MKDIQKIQSTLTRMAELLRQAAIEDWAAALESIKHEIVVDERAALTKIISMYGGMGSLNDLVLYRNGQLLVRENNEFDLLRSELHALCRA